MTFDLSSFLSLYGFPSTYLWAVYVGMVAFAIPLMFFGKKMWQVVTFFIGVIAGFYVGYVYVTPYLTSFMIQHSMPSWFFDAVLAGLFAFLLRFFVHFGISLGIGYLAYDAAEKQTFFNLSAKSSTIMGFTLHWYLIVIGVFAFVIAYFLYAKISVLVAGALGALTMYFGLSFFIAPTFAAIPAVIILFIGMWYQIGVKRRVTFKDPEDEKIAELKKQRKLAALQIKIDKQKIKIGGDNIKIEKDLKTEAKIQSEPPVNIPPKQ